jgi:P27 family predicted phage terminase small subunit
LSIQPPKFLKAESRAWWLSIVQTYELEDHHIRLLTLAAGAWDRAEQARLALLKKGITYDDHNGNPRQRPEIMIERDARILFARLVKQLGLDDAEVPSRLTPGLRAHRRVS